MLNEAIQAATHKGIQNKARTQIQEPTEEQNYALSPTQNLLKCSCLVERRAYGLIRIQRTSEIHQKRRDARLLPLHFCNPNE